MNDEIFDFGFTIVDESELDAVQQATAQVQTVSTTVESTQQKLDRLYNAIQPLLNNLKKNPEKDYIKWPNRKPIIEAQIERILEITRD